MKKTFILILSLFMTLGAFAQQYSDWSRWSITLEGGLNRFDGDVKQDYGREVIPTGDTKITFGGALEYTLTPVWSIGLDYYYLPLSAETDVLISRVFRSVLVILAASCLWNLVGLYVEHSEEYGGLPGVEIDLILVPFLSRVLKVVIAALALIVLLQEWDYDVNGFIAGLGLGGLAFALAAQQTLSNVFGGIVIITDKPFSIGDWILTPSVEGIVEDINFRSTRIRTFAQAVVTVPNSTLANEPITNWSRMGKRRITFTLGLTYDTPRDKIEKCIQKIRAMLQNHTDVHPETILVYFDSYGDSSLNIFLYFFTRSTVWEEYLRVKEDVNLRIMGILEEEGVSMALPSTSIYFENELRTRVNARLDLGNGRSSAD